MHPKITDIVRFTRNAKTDAAKFCAEHGLTGKIVNIKDDFYIIDVGFPYNIYSTIDEFVVYVRQIDVPIYGDVE